MHLDRTGQRTAIAMALLLIAAVVLKLLGVG